MLIEELVHEYDEKNEHRERDVKHYINHLMRFLTLLEKYSDNGMKVSDEQANNAPIRVKTSMHNLYEEFRSMKTISQELKVLAQSISNGASVKEVLEQINAQLIKEKKLILEATENISNNIMKDLSGETYVFENAKDQVESLQLFKALYKKLKKESKIMDKVSGLA